VLSEGMSLPKKDAAYPCIEDGPWCTGLDRRGRIARATELLDRQRKTDP